MNTEDKVRALQSLLADTTQELSEAKQRIKIFLQLMHGLQSQQKADWLQQGVESAIREMDTINALLESGLDRINGAN